MKIFHFLGGHADNFMTHSVISTPSQSLEGLVRLNCCTGAIPDHTWKGATCPEQEAPFCSGRMGDPSQRPLSPAELPHAQDRYLDPQPSLSQPSLPTVLSSGPCYPCSVTLFSNFCWFLLFPVLVLALP